MNGFQFPIIDMKATGERIRGECLQRGYSAREIKEYLGLGSIQSVYNWFGGKTLPSLEHMFALSCLLAKSLEELVVMKGRCQDQEEDDGFHMSPGNPVPAEDIGKAESREDIRDMGAGDRLWQYWRRAPSAAEGGAYSF